MSGQHGQDARAVRGGRARGRPERVNTTLSSTSWLQRRGKGRRRSRSAGQDHRSQMAGDPPGADANARTSAVARSLRRSAILTAGSRGGSVTSTSCQLNAKSTQPVQLGRRAPGSRQRAGAAPGCRQALAGLLVPHLHMCREPTQLGQGVPASSQGASAPSPGCQRASQQASEPPGSMTGDAVRCSQ